MNAPPSSNGATTAAGAIRIERVKRVPMATFERSGNATIRNEWARGACALGVAAAITLASGHAAAQDKQACVSAYEDAQRLRKDGKLTEARSKLLVCAQDACPAIVRKDCTVWISEVEQATPTVLLAARGPSGTDVVDVAVTLDGKPITKRLDGKAIALDPGPHTFRFELAGAPPHDETILLQQGERNRQVLADFQPPEARDPHPAGAAPAPPPMRPAPVPAGAYVLGGLGVAGLGVFTAFGLMGLSAKSDLDARACKPNCASSDVDPVKQKFLVADIGLGVGVASLIVATVIFATKGQVAASDSSVHVDVAPAQNGASIALRAAF